MTAKQVRATCWGEPDHVDRRETARGVTERYVYGDGRVILHNGIVNLGANKRYIAVVQSGMLRK